MNLKLVTTGAALFALALTSCQNLNKKDSDFLGQDGDFVSGTPLGNRNENVNFMSGNVNKSMFEPVYFGFDSFTIDSSETPKLERAVEYLRSNRGDLIVAGFTDERGTAEYNRALGEKRALAVREYLAQKGVNPGRVQTVSFGEELPADPGSGDGAWARNRRAEFGLVQ